MGAKPRLLAYPDSKCVFGYMTVHDKCLDDVPKHIDRTAPMISPPAVGKEQECEICRKIGVLQNP